jgi:hypothetical protein
MQEHPEAGGPTAEGPPPDGMGGAVAWRPGRVRKGPALIIIAIVAVVCIIGFVIAALGGKTQQTTTSVGKTVPGTGIDVAAGGPLFKPVTSGGDPPSDVLAALPVPADSTVTSHELGDGLELYSGTITLSAPYSTGNDLTFYKYELKRNGWSFSGPAASPNGGGTEVFGTRASSDGYYWEVGVVISGANPSLAPALNGGATPAGASTISLTVFERDDAD